MSEPRSSRSRSDVSSPGAAPRLFGEINRLLRGELNTILLLATALMATAFAVIRWRMADLELALLEAVFAVLFFAVAAWEHRNPGGRAAPITIVFGGFAMMSVIAFTTGGLYSTAHRWLCVLPLVAVFLGSARLAWSVAGVTIAQSVAAAAGWLGPLPAPGEAAGSPSLHMWSAIGLTTFVLVIALAYDRFRAESVRRLAEANAALGRANEEAQVANVAKSQFLASLSHELRTPLAGIVGRASLLAGSAPSDDTREELHAIERSGQSLLAVFDSMLDFSRAETGARSTAETVVVTEQLVADLLSAFGHPARVAGLELRAEVSDDVPPRFILDGGRLNQVLVNLIGNALKFTEEGSVTLSIETRGERLRFSVEDTGAGLPEGDLERLFLPFTQADASTSRRHGGVGLGLAISRELTTQLGGALTAHAADGGGAVFVLETPFRPAPADTQDPDDTEAAGRVPRQNVLLVEDTDVIRTVGVAMLKRLGHEVRSAATGEEGLELLAGGSFDVVLLDCHLPGIDGFEVARRLRARKSPEGHTRIVAMTADTSDEIRQRCLAAGMDGFLTKPFTPTALQAVLTPDEETPSDPSLPAP
jgi:signal transduction histidine kinase/ActR/RegA family two-component response regulator